MSTRARIRSGAVHAVYDDRWHALLCALGPARIERASEVEYDHGARHWVAVHRSSGREIARGANRGDVIASEIRWLEERL